MTQERHLIADFDGVIGDTFQMNWAITRSLHPEVAEASYRIDHHMGNVFEAPVVPFTPQTSEMYWRLYNEQLAVSHISVALPALSCLANYFRLHIVTSNCEVAIARVLREAAVHNLFGHILGRQAHASKVEKFKLLADVDDFDLEDAIFVTDTLGDLKEAAKVGLPAVAVTFGYHTREILATGNPRAIVDTWDEFL